MTRHKILIIDDQPINIELIVKILEETNEPYTMYQDIARSGEYWDYMSYYKVAAQVLPL